MGCCEFSLIYWNLDNIITSLVQSGTQKVNYTRPKNLNLLTIRFPLPAIASILHRISGFFLCLLIPFMLWLLSYSLTDVGFYDLQYLAASPWVRLFFWVLMAPFCYHLMAGIRHLLSDMHIGNTLKTSKCAVLAVFAFTGLLLILVGIWLW